MYKCAIKALMTIRQRFFISNFLAYFKFLEENFNASS